MSWETIDEFKQNTGMKLDDSVIQNALDEAVISMKSFIFIPRIYQSMEQKTRHILTQQTMPYAASTVMRAMVNPRVIFIADRNADRVVDKNDLNCYEVDFNYTIFDLNASVSAFNVKFGVVDFSISVPTASDRTLIIEFYEQKDFIENILPLLKELNELLAVNWAFQKIPFSKLQSGIPSWTINGVSVTFEKSAIDSVIEGNKSRIKELYNLLIPTFTIFNTLQYGKPSVRDFSGSVGFVRGGGY